MSIYLNTCINCGIEYNKYEKTDTMTSIKVHSSPITKSKDTKIFKTISNLTLKLINNAKWKTNKHMNTLKMILKELDKKFTKEIGIQGEKKNLEKWEIQ